MKIVDAKCKNCGAELTFDSGKTMLYCPYCGTKLLIIDGDAVKVEKAKADAYRDVELAREETKREKNRQEHEREKEMIEKGDNVRIELERLKTERQTEREKHRHERRMQKLRYKHEKAQNYAGEDKNKRRWTEVIVSNLFTTVSMIVILIGIHQSKDYFSNAKLIITLGGLLLIISAFLAGRKDERMAASIGSMIASLIYLGIAKYSASLYKVGYRYNDMVNLMLFLGMVALIVSIINLIRKARETYLGV